MRRKAARWVVAIVAILLVAFVAIPGCKIKLCKGDGCGSGPDVGGWGGGGSSGTQGGGGAGGTGKTPEQEAEEAYAALDPQVRSLAGLKAGATTSYLAGTMETLDIDPTTMDETAFLAFMEQYGPNAQAAIEQWMATLDPSMIPPTAVYPPYKCTDEFGCAYKTTCMNEPFASMNHLCFVNDCGDAKCSSCPDWFPDFLKKLILSAWCSYVCVEANVAYPKVVAVGAGGVSAFKGIFVGAYCFPP